MTTKVTPMIRQFQEIKQKNLDKILFFRVGDFYEMFFEDAKIASRELEITLTSRETGKDNHVPLAGVPYHAAAAYIAKLINKGYKVAICEQVEDPKEAKGLVKREIIRTITPGTVIEGNILEDNKNNYLAALILKHNKWGLAYIDYSTGEFKVTEFNKKDFKLALDELSKLSPAECLVPTDNDIAINIEDKLTQEGCFPLIDKIATEMFTSKKAEDTLKNHFKDRIEKVSHLLHNHKAASICTTVIIEYLSKGGGSLNHIRDIKFYNPQQNMALDATTRRNLELTSTLRERKLYGSLLWVIDKTKTSMGSRRLKKWIEEPIINKDEIEKRLDVVAEISEKDNKREEIINSLKEIYDLERLIGRINFGNANARDLIALKKTLEVLPSLKETLKDMDSTILNNMYHELYTLDHLKVLLTKAIEGNPPITLREGGLIKDGFDSELDQLRSISRNTKEWILKLEEQEKERTGIKNLKIRYNKVFGYYIEVTRSKLSQTPDNYIRKQTLVNAERFITQDLKEKEGIILGAEEKISELEYRLFQTIREKVILETVNIQETAAIIAELDCLHSLAKVAIEERYIRPKLVDMGEIIIEDGRHPVVEKVLNDSYFIPNDTELNNKNKIMLITGPNMAGKSTYLRQVALITLMAHIGSFVPASKAKICPVDRIFTRVGASDDLAGGQSTFMVEMNELANIVNNATERSLLILDEIGRGTSTYDGLSIAWATIEFIAHNLKAKTLFATHYHELTDIEEKFEIVNNYSIAIKEKDEEITFLRKIIKSKADRSYGIQVAKLAGLPDEIISRSFELLNMLENGDMGIKETGQPNYAKQLSILNYKDKKSELKEEILKIDLLTITPLECMQKIFELQKKIKKTDD